MSTVGEFWVAWCACSWHEGCQVLVHERRRRHRTRQRPVCHTGLQVRPCTGRERKERQRNSVLFYQPWLYDNVTVTYLGSSNMLCSLLWPTQAGPALAHSLLAFFPLLLSRVYQPANSDVTLLVWPRANSRTTTWSLAEGGLWDWISTCSHYLHHFYADSDWLQMLQCRLGGLYAAAEAALKKTTEKRRTLFF